MVAPTGDRSVSSPTKPPFTLWKAKEFLSSKLLFRDDISGDQQFYWFDGHELVACGEWRILPYREDGFVTIFKTAGIAETTFSGDEASRLINCFREKLLEQWEYDEIARADYEAATQHRRDNDWDD